jgi:phospholipid transport system substrate-binding protein
VSIGNRFRSIGRHLAGAMLVAVLALAGGGVASAQTPTPPDELVQQTTREVLELLRESGQEIEQNPKKVFDAVRALVLPHFDFELMGRFVLARNWQQATVEQQQRFTEEFRELLVRTYGTALAEYSGQEVRFPPMNADLERGRATVPMEIVQPDGPAIPLSYSLYRTDDEWKVFDVTVDGVSLVQNYRSTFATEVQRNGIDGLIKRLAERNAQGEVDETIVE